MDNAFKFKLNKNRMGILLISIFLVSILSLFSGSILQALAADTQDDRDLEVTLHCTLESNSLEIESDSLSTGFYDFFEDPELTTGEFEHDATLVDVSRIQLPTYNTTSRRYYQFVEGVNTTQGNHTIFFEIPEYDLSKPLDTFLSFYFNYTAMGYDGISLYSDDLKSSMWSLESSLNSWFTAREYYSLDSYISGSYPYKDQNYGDSADLHVSNSNFIDDLRSGYSWSAIVNDPELRVDPTITADMRISAENPSTNYGTEDPCVVRRIDVSPPGGTLSPTDYYVFEISDEFQDYFLNDYKGIITYYINSTQDPENIAYLYLQSVQDPTDLNEMTHSWSNFLFGSQKDTNSDLSVGYHEMEFTDTKTVYLIAPSTALDTGAVYINSRESVNPPTSYYLISKFYQNVNGYTDLGDGASDYGYSYVQTNTTEMVKLRSPNYGEALSMLTGEYINVTLQTTGNSEIKINFLNDDAQIEQMVLLSAGNTNYNPQVITLNLDTDIVFDQIELEMELDDTEFLKVFEVEFEEPVSEIIYLKNEAIDLSYFYDDILSDIVLYLYLNSKTYSDIFDLHAYNTSDFTEGSLTWSNAPTSTDLISSLEIDPDNDEGSYVSIPLEPYLITYLLLKSDYNSKVYFTSSEGDSGQRPYLLYNLSKVYQDTMNGYIYAQTNETETLKLKSPAFNHLTMRASDSIELSFQTTTNKEVLINLYNNSLLQTQLTLLENGNSNFNQQTIKINLTEEIQFDQIELEMELDDTKYFKLYDVDFKGFLNNFINATYVNITYQKLGITYSDMIKLSQTEGNYQYSQGNYSYTADSSEFSNYDYLNDLTILNQNLTIYLYFAENLDFDFNLSSYINYSTSTWKVPSEIEYNVNNEQIIDESYNSGFVSLSTFPNDLTLAADLPVYSRLNITTDFYFTFDLDVVSKTYLRKTFTLLSDHDIIIERIDLPDHFQLKKIYLNNEDLGSANPNLLNPDITMTPGNTYTLEIILSDDIYLRMPYADDQYHTLYSQLFEENSSDFRYWTYPDNHQSNVSIDGDVNMGNEFPKETREDDLDDWNVSSNDNYTDTSFLEKTLSSVLDKYNATLLNATHIQTWNGTVLSVGDLLDTDDDFSTWNSTQLQMLNLYYDFADYHNESGYFYGTYSFEDFVLDFINYTLGSETFDEYATEFFNYTLATLGMDNFTGLISEFINYSLATHTFDDIVTAFFNYTLATLGMDNFTGLISEFVNYSLATHSFDFTMEEGYYYGTYDFNNETITGEHYHSSFDFEDDGFASLIEDKVYVLSYYDEHADVLVYGDDSTSYNYFSDNRDNGTIEFWISHYSESSPIYVDLYSDDSFSMVQLWIYPDSIRFYYGDGLGGSTYYSYSHSGWTHIKIEFNCTSNNYTAYADGNLVVNGENFRGDLDKDHISMFRLRAPSGRYGVIDAVGYSWDINYTIGDNLNPVGQYHSTHSFDEGCTESGYYYGSPDSFNDEDLGDYTSNPTDIDWIDSVGTPGGTITISTFDNHKKTLNLECDGSSNTYLRHDIIQTSSSTFEFFLGSTDTTHRQFFLLRESTTNIVYLWLENDVLNYVDNSGNLQSLANIVDNTLYHIRIDVRVDNTMDIYVNGVKEANNVNTRDVMTSGIDNVLLKVYDNFVYTLVLDAYWDSIEGSGSAGDNLNPYGLTSELSDCIDEYQNGNDGSHIGILSVLDNHEYVFDLYDNSTDKDINDYLRIKNEFSDKSSGTIEFWYRSDDTTQDTYFLSYNGGYSIYVYVDSDKVKYYYSGSSHDSNGGIILDNTWNHFRIDFDYSTKTYDFYLNGSLLDSDIPFRDVGALEIAELMITTGTSNHNFHVYIDDISYSWDPNYQVGDNLHFYGKIDEISSFITSHSNRYNCNITIEEKEGHYNVLSFEADEEHGMSFSNEFSEQTSGTIELWMYFNTATNDDFYFIFTEDLSNLIQVRFYHSDEIRIYYGDGIGGLATEIVYVESDEWQHLRVDFDCSSDTFDLYMNGTLELDGVNFYNDQTPSYLNSIAVYSADSCKGWIDAVGYSWDSTSHSGLGYSESWNINPYNITSLLNEFAYDLITPHGATVKVVDFDNHDTVLAMNGTTVDTQVKSSFDSPQSSGTIETWIGYGGTANAFFYFYNEISQSSICILLNQGGNTHLQAYDGGSKNYYAYNIAPNKLHHLKIEFDCSTDTYDLYFNGTLVADDASFRYNADTLDYMYLFAPRSSDFCYLDSIGYSWDSGYDVGDNTLLYDVSEIEELGWEITGAYDCYAYINQTVDNQFDVLEIFDNSTDTSITLTDNFNQEIEEGTIEFRIKSSDASKQLSIYFEYSNSENILFRIVSDKIQYRTASGWYDMTGGSISDDTWYEIRIDFDCSTDTYDFYINDVLKEENIDFKINGDSINRIRLITSNSHSNYYYFLDNFTYYNYGYNTSELEDSGWTIDSQPYNSYFTIVDNLEEHSSILRINDNNDNGNIEIYDAFSDQTSGTIEFWFRTEDATPLKNIQIQDGSSHSIYFIQSNNKFKYWDGVNPVEDIAPAFADTWYHIRIEFDCADDWHLWINGSSMDGGSGYGFRGSPTAMDTFLIRTYNSEGEFLIDNIGYSFDAGYDVGDNLIKYNYTQLETLNWEITPAYGCHVIVNESVDTQYDVLEIYDNNTGAQVILEDTLENSFVNGTLEFKFRTTNSNDEIGFFFMEGTDERFEFKVDNGKLSYYFLGWNDLTGGSILDNTWYEFRLDFDCYNKIVDFYLNDSLLELDLNFKHPATSYIDSIKIKTNIADSDYLVYLDNFTLYRYGYNTSELRENNWTFYQAYNSHIRILDHFEEHSSVLKLNERCSYAPIIATNEFEAQSSGTVEFWVMTDDTSETTSITLYNATDQIFFLTIDSNLKNYDGSYHTLSPVDSDKWYHFRIEFNCSIDKYNLTVNGVLLGLNLNFWKESNNLNQIKFSGAFEDYSIYIDNIGYSWDLDYSIKDNTLLWNQTITNENWTSSFYDAYSYVEVVDELDGHLDVFSIHDNSSESMNITLINELTPYEARAGCYYDTFSYWIRMNNVSKEFYMYFNNETDNLISIKYSDLNFYSYYNDQWNSFKSVSWSADEWVWFEIVIDYETNQIGIAFNERSTTTSYFNNSVHYTIVPPGGSYSFDTWVKEVQFITSTSQINTSIYLDAIGFESDTFSHFGLGYERYWNVNPYNITNIVSEEDMYITVNPGKESYITTTDHLGREDVIKIHPSASNDEVIYYIGSESFEYNPYAYERSLGYDINKLSFYLLVDDLTDPDFTIIIYSLSTYTNRFKIDAGGDFKYLDPVLLDWQVLFSGINEDTWYYFEIYFSDYNKKLDVYLDTVFKGRVDYVSTLPSSQDANLIVFSDLGSVSDVYIDDFKHEIFTYQFINFSTSFQIPNIDDNETIDDLSLFYSVNCSNIAQDLQVKMFNFTSGEYDLVEQINVNSSIQEINFDIASDYYNSTEHFLIRFEFANDTGAESGFPYFQISLDRLVISANWTKTGGSIYAALNKTIVYDFLNRYDNFSAYQILYNITVEFTYQFENNTVYDYSANCTIFNTLFELNTDNSTVSFSYLFEFNSTLLNSFDILFNITNGNLTLSNISFTFIFECLDLNDETKLYQHFRINPSFTIREYMQLDPYLVLNFTYSLNASTWEYDYYTPGNDTIFTIVVSVQSDSDQWIHYYYNKNSSLSEAFSLNIRQVILNHSMTDFRDMYIDFYLIGNDTSFTLDDFYIYNRLESVQMTAGPRTDEDTVDFYDFLVADRTYSRWYAYNTKTINTMDLEIMSTAEEIAYSSLIVDSPKYYFDKEIQNNEILLAYTDYNPNWVVSYEVRENTGTAATLRIAYKADLNIKNVTIVLDLSSDELYMSTWNHNASQRSTNFVLEIPNVDFTTSTKYLTLTGTAAVPTAEIYEFACQEMVWIDQNATRSYTYHGYIEYPLFSQSFRLTGIEDEWTLDGVRHGSKTMDIRDDNGYFECEGFGTSITESYLKFKVNPVDSFRVFDYQNGTLLLEIKCNLPIQNASVYFALPSELRYEIQSSHDGLTQVGEDVLGYDIYFFMTSDLKQGTNNLQVDYKIHTANDDLRLFIPLSLLFVVGIGLYLYTKRKERKTRMATMTETQKKAYLKRREQEAGVLTKTWMVLKEFKKDWLTPSYFKNRKKNKSKKKMKKTKIKKPRVLR